MDDSVFEVCECALCNKPITDHKDEIKCSVCNSKYHELCAKKNDNMQTWNCATCATKNQTLALQIPKAPKSATRSKNFSKGASGSTSSSKAKALLEALEEEKELLKRQAEDKERLLNETHEREMMLLKKKQEVLQDIASSKSGSSRKSGLSVPKISSREKVNAWIKENSTDLVPHLLKESAVQTDPIRIESQSYGVQRPEQFRAEAFLPKPLMGPTFNVTKDTTVNKIGQANTIPPKEVADPKCNINKEAYPSKPLMSSTINVNEDTTITKSNQVDKIPPKGTIGATFNISRDNNRIAPAGFSGSFRHNLSREEVAARHVVKDLPEFDGNPRKWPKFITSYHRSTNICGFSDVENLDRLMNCLKGKALAAVGNSLSLEENVPRILETLETLFGKPEFIISCLIEDMKKSSPPAADCIDSIIQYSLEVENISATMRIAKLSEHLWNPILLSEMIERLPCNLKLEWAIHKYNHPESNIEVFSLWLKNKAMTYATVLVKPPNLRSTESSKPKAKHSVNVHQESQLHKCIVCSGNCKKVEECDSFKSLKLNEKWDVVRKYQLCRICLTKHRSIICSKNEVCGVEGCSYRHHSLLHKIKTQEIPEAAEQQVVNLHHNTVRTYFKILPVHLSNGTKSITVYAMLDDGSSLTLMDHKVARKLDLSGSNQPLCLRWTGNIERTDCKSEVINLYVSPCNSSQQVFKFNDVRTVEDLNLPRQTVDMKSLAELYGHLRDVPAVSFINAQPSILIGLNHTKLMSVKKYKFGMDGEPAAAKTVLGWCIFGANNVENSEVFHINHCECQESLNQKLEEMVRENYSLEAIGVSNPISALRSKEDVRALKILDSTTNFDGKRYEVGLLWKYDNISLPDNWSMAVKRQRCLEKRFQHEPELLQIIIAQIEEYVAKGYARKLHDSDTEVKENSWFLPIFIVRNPNKPNKIRMVWDAAAQFGGVSLNKILLKGPDLLASLPGVLLRFREHKVALSGDIKEMFHQVGIRKEDRRYQRFIWRQSIDAEFDVYEMNVMTFGAACSPSCSQYVKNLNAEKFRSLYPKAAEAIQWNHYVDDWLESVDSSTQAIDLASEVKDVHARGGFE